MLRERAGARQITIELPEGARVRDALDSLGDLAAGLPLVMAVNREYAPEDHVLDPGDELALIPPVSGGSGAAPAPPRGTSQPLSLDSIAARVRDPRAGAVVTFQGVTRDVDRLEDEAYVEMAGEGVARVGAGGGGGAERRDRGGGRRAARTVCCRCRASDRRRPAERAERDRGGVVGASRGGVRGRARDHRPREGRGADLEEGDREWRGTLGRGHPALTRAPRRARGPRWRPFAR